MMSAQSSIPSREQCLELLHKNGTPQNVIEHCKAVCAFAVSLAKKLRHKGIDVDIGLIEAAALLHDIEKLKPDHELAGSILVTRAGFTDVGNVMKTHGLARLYDDSFLPKSIEQRIVFYADKRVMHSTVASLDERFQDIKTRYAKIDSNQIEAEMRFSRSIEHDLMQLLGEHP
jgi:putative nucleotidyltransferase with HDIG domain